MDRKYKISAINWNRILKIQITKKAKKESLCQPSIANLLQKIKQLILSKNFKIKERELETA